MSVRKLGIYIPSYKRADTIMTHTILEYYKVVVRKSEENEYLKKIPKENIIAVNDEEIDSLIKVMNWITENSEEDIIAVLGDDMKDCIYRLDKNVKVNDKEIITSELERIAQLMCDLDIGYGCVDATCAPWNYCSEFAFTGTSGGIFWINKRKFKSRNREEIGYCCDTDIVMQELLQNRIVLKPKYFCSHGGTDTNKGGNSGKTRESMIRSFETMKNVWGKYFDYDLKSNKIYIRVKR